MWWMLAREVLRMRGSIARGSPWDVMVDLYFYRDPEEAEKEEQQAQAQIQDRPIKETSGDFQPEQWGGDVGVATVPTEVSDVRLEML